MSWNLSDPKMFSGKQLSGIIKIFKSRVRRLGSPRKLDEFGWKRAFSTTLYGRDVYKRLATSVRSIFI